MKNIRTVKALHHYLLKNSGFENKTIKNVLKSLGFTGNGSFEALKELSVELENCALNGAQCGVPGFIYYNETIAFFKTNRKDIVNHIEKMAVEFGTDIISMVQNFGVFRNGSKPTTGEVGKALYDTCRIHPELTSLYNVFSWYALEEVSYTWLMYLEENPSLHAALAA